MTLPALLAPPPPVVAPVPETNQIDRAGAVSAPSAARDMVRRHASGLAARRQRDLISEKLLLHIDGSNDWQWAAIYGGTRIAIPRLVSEFRKTENLLRPIVDNAVAHHTTMPLRYMAESSPDRRARDRARIDGIWINYLAQQQHFNTLFSDALYLAMPAGFCPVHRYWRDGWVDTYEPIAPDAAAGTPQSQMLRRVLAPGMIDCWVGNPFDMVFDKATKRGSIYSVTYGRMLPADLVRATWDHVPGVQGMTGSMRIPSASMFQQIAQKWRMESLGIHGTPVMNAWREGKSDRELLYVLCEEILPGVEAQWPNGHLKMAIVPGEVDLRSQMMGGEPILVSDQDLPAKDFSWTLFYSHHRGDDVHGKPWVEDLDQIQVELNIARSERWAQVKKMADAPIVAPGGVLDQDMMDVGGYLVMEVEQSASSWRPQVMRYPVEILNALDKEIDDLRSTMFRLGGYQAVSRGESPGTRTPYRAILALQQADNTIHGPVNQRFQEAACAFAVGCWRQFKAFGDKPWLIDIVGDEYAHLAEPYINKAKLSDRPPRLKLTNAFGATPEIRAQEILQLAATRGADGEPMLTTEEARRLYPNEFLFPDSNVKAVRRRRARTIVAAFESGADALRNDLQLGDREIASQWVRMAAIQLFFRLEQDYPRRRDDDLQAHLDAYSELTQDETADPIARLACSLRQDQYYEWQAMMAAAVMAPAGAPQLGQRPDVLHRQEVAADMGGRPRAALPPGRSPMPLTATAR